MQKTQRFADNILPLQIPHYLNAKLAICKLQNTIFYLKLHPNPHLFSQILTEINFPHAQSAETRRKKFHTDRHRNIGYFSGKQFFVVGCR